MERFVAMTKATVVYSSFAVKASPSFVCLSLPPQSKKPFKFQVLSYTVEKVRNTGIHSLSLTIFLSANR